MAYLAHRLFHGFLLLAGVSLLSFLFFELAPGSFFDEMKLNPQISATTVSNLRKQYGMDKSLPTRYFRWLRSVASGQLGFSFAYDMPVTNLLWPRARNTLLLTGSAMFLTWLIALPVGILSAERPGSWTDSIGSLSTSMLLATPDLLLALGLLLLALRTHWLPVGGISSLESAEHGGWEQARSMAQHLVGPLIALVLGGLPLLVRHVRAAMIEALDSPYVRAAHAHGIRRWRVLLCHALPAAANPLVSLFGLSFGSLLSASLLTEVVMSWPGMGPLLLEAILARDFYVVIGAVMLTSVFFVGGILIGDVLLFAIDPRIRTEGLA